MPTRVELQKLAGVRLQEAQLLQAAGLSSGAYYLAGYVLEAALKACVCRRLDLFDYPESELDRKPFLTHKPHDLVLLAGLKNTLRVQLTDPVFQANWDLASSWKPENRYLLSKTGKDSGDLIQALTDPKGVLPWLSNLW